MRKLLLLSAGVAFLAMPAGAKDITLSQAKAIAAKYVTLGQGKKAQRFKAPSATATSAPDFYAFNDVNGKGFVLIAGDDCVTPVLGYSTNSTFSQDDMAPSLKAWLDAVSADIQTKRENGKAAATVTDSDNRTVVVEPMVKTHWDQSRPYHDLTPTINGMSTMTGCVATAVSQVMNFYQWPVKGTGSIHYDTPSYDTKTMDVDFSQSTYDWNNMCNDYTLTNGVPDWNETQGKAVAQLMHDVGAAVRMSYGVQSSGAWGADIANAMRTYFSYNAKHYQKYDYTTPEWIELNKKLLDSGTPLIYGAQSYKNGGHEYIIDGYDSNNFLHVNWGWSGKGDGFFTFNNFGTGTALFNLYMNIVQITPNKTGTTEPEEQTMTLVIADILKDGQTTDEVKAEKADFSAQLSLNIQHASWRNVDGMMRYALKDANGDIVKTFGDRAVTTTSATETTKVEEAITGETFEGIADGTYALTVQLKDKRTDGTPFDEWCDCIYGPKHLSVNISNGVIALNNVLHNNGHIVVKSLQFDKNTADFGEDLTWKVTFDTSDNEDNLMSNAVLMLKNTDDPTAKSVIASDIDVTVFAGQKNEFATTFKLLNSANFKPGNYQAVIYIYNPFESYREDIPGDPVTLTVSINPDRYAKAYVDKASMTLHMDDGQDVDCDLSDGKVVNIDMSQDVSDVYFDYDVKWITPTPAPARYQVYYHLVAEINGKKENKLTLGYLSEDDATVHFEINTFDEVFDEENYGKEVIWQIYYNVPYSSINYPVYDKNGNEVNIKSYIYDSTTGINDLNAQTQGKEYFDLQGRRISAPAKGINIVRTANGKTKKVLVK